MTQFMYRSTPLGCAIALVCASVIPSTTAEANPGPTFNEHIAPIVFSQCSGCHRPGEAAPFPLLSFRDVAKRGKQIAQVTEERFMPPWHAEPSDFPFANTRRLTDNEIALIRNWVENGMAEGDPDALAPFPVFADGWQLGEPDLIVRMPEPFTIPADGPDLYRNFAIPLNLKEDRWVRAIEFRPGARSVVHHSLFFVDETGSARKADADDPEPGFRRMGLALQRGGRLGGWAVGGSPRQLPDGLAHRLPAGSDLILSTHFHPSGKAETEESVVGFFFADEPPSQEFTGIQLPPLFGALAGVDIPAGVSEYTVTDSFVLPVGVRAFAVSAHAHYLGKELRMTATFPGSDGETKTLLRIDDWDFSWQDQYNFASHVDLPAGTRLDARVVWDNSAENVNNPNHPPRRVKWGRESTDEMGSITLQVVATEPEQFSALTESIREHRRTAAGHAIRARLKDRVQSGGSSRLQNLLQRRRNSGSGTSSEP